MAASKEDKLDPSVVSALYVEHAGELRRFLLGVLKDHSLAGDCLQATFAKVLTQGHTSQESTRKAWLFRVAYNEAMLLLRKQSVDGRAREKLSWVLPQATAGGEETLVRFETVQQVQAAISRLTTKQREVLILRIYEEKTFAEVAEELNIPLGTALARMHAALKKLREILSSGE